MSVRETRRRQYTQHVIGRHDVDSTWRMKDQDTRRGGGGGRGSGVGGVVAAMEPRSPCGNYFY